MVSARRGEAAAVLLAAWLAAGPARAEPPHVRDPARAEVLFQEGRALFEQGRYAEACERLERSDALDPAPSTMGLLAGCLERTGRPATAWKAYLEAAERDDATNPERAAFARKQAAALEPRLPKLAISLDRPAPGAEVLVNGEPWPREALGKDVPVDPGPQKVLVRAPGRAPFSRTVEAREETRLVVEVPELEPAPSSPAPTRGNSRREPSPPAPSRGAGPLRPVALVVGGVGLVGLGVGVALGLTALGKKSESEELFDACGQGLGGCERSEALWGESRSAANFSTLGFGVGALGLGVAATLYVLSSESGSESGSQPEARPAEGFRIAPVASPAGGGVLVRRRF